MPKNAFVARALAALAVTLSATAVTAQEGPVKIGVLLSLSGGFANPSKQMLEGMELVVEKAGGTFGGREVELVVLDDQGKPELAVEMARRLTRSEKVDFVTGVGLSSIMVAVHRPILASKTFLVGSNSGLGNLAGEDCSPYYFSTSSQNNQNAEALGSYLQTAGVEKLMLLAPNYQGGKDFMTGIRRYYEGEPVEDVLTPMQQTDYAAEISKIRAADLNGVAVFYPGAWGVQWIKQYAQSGLAETVPMYSVYTTDETNIAATGTDAEGMLGATFWAVDLPNDNNKAFVDAYRAKYDTPPTQYVAMGYESMQLIESAVDALDGDLSDDAAVQAALEKADFPSVRGKFSFNSNHFPIQDFYITKVEEKDGELLPFIQETAATDATDAYADACKM